MLELKKERVPACEGPMCVLSREPCGGQTNQKPHRCDFLCPPLTPLSPGNSGS